MNIFDNSISVSELNGYIKTMMESDDFLASVAIRGEISNFKNNVSGHLYFSVKDEGAAVSAVMFKTAASRLNFRPCDGMKVTIYGRVSVYEKTGQYQIYVQTMTSDGAGELARAYEMLKCKLESEGLFAEERKRAIPSMPKRIGIVTSPTGAALRDMINVTGRRYPLADIVLFPSSVQGVEAPPQLCMGIEFFNAMKNVDVIIIGRGGGSIEDLWAFNDEALVRAVAASEIPVISAVGHQTDFTLCDFAADLRAPTPSAAAEIAVPDIAVLRSRLSQANDGIRNAMQNFLKKRSEHISLLERVISLNSPISRLENSKLGLIHLGTRIENSMLGAMRESKGKLAELSAKLEGMNPLSILSRGYSAIRDGEGKMIHKLSQINVGESISVIMNDGEAKATVNEISFKERQDI